MSVGLYSQYFYFPNNEIVCTRIQHQKQTTSNCKKSENICLENICRLFWTTRFIHNQYYDFLTMNLHVQEFNVRSKLIAKHLKIFV
jgi:hypothetical protein